MTSHEQLWIHLTRHGPNSGEATTFPHIVYFVPLRDTHIRMIFLSRDSQGRVSQLSQFGLSGLCTIITPCSDLRLGWGLKKTCSSPWELSNSVSHSTWTHRGWVDSRLLVVGSQTASLIPGLSFCHNLCCKCPNGSCEPIFDIYTSLVFQWYKKTPKCKVFWPLQSNSEVSGVPEDSQVPISGMWVSSSHFPQSRVMTIDVQWPSEVFNSSWVFFFCRWCIHSWGSFLNVNFYYKFWK